MRRVLPLLAALALASPAHALQPRIIGGHDAAEGQFPYVANVKTDTFQCSGSLISPTWVLTAGHCVSISGGGGVPLPLTYPATAYTVTLGTTAQDGTGGQDLQVKSVHVDPNYSLQNGLGSDVGLLELTQPAGVAPVKIAAQSERSIWEPGDIMTIAGFGTTTTDGAMPDRMQYAQVPIVSDADCSAAYNDKTPVLGDAFDPATAVCAGYPQGGTDTCSGDSGGPLLAPTGDTFRLVGSTSYGEGCAQPGKPGVYARLAEGSVKTFISGLVPDAYAPEGTQPQPTAGSCKGVSLRLRGHFKRAKVFVDGRRITVRRKPGVVRLSSHLDPSQTTRVRILKVKANGRKHRTSLLFTGCTLTKT